MKYNIKVEVFNEDVTFELPTKHKELIAFINDKASLVPDEFADTTKIELKQNDYFSSLEIYLVVSYIRLEINSEEKEREMIALNTNGATERREREMLRKLLEKYPEERGD